MATAQTVSMGPPHSPKEESIKAFEHIDVDLKRLLQHLRHDTNKHEPAFFARVQDLSDYQLTAFSSENLKEVRVADSAYGKHLFGKVELPEATVDGNAYFMFRAFVPGGPETTTLHSIHMEESERPDGSKRFRAIFRQEDPLEFFGE